MAQRRPITTHPAFKLLLALWFAALFGLALAVLPAAQLERALGAASLGGIPPLSSEGRIAAIGAAALLGALIGLALGTLLARRGLRDPRPTYAETGIAFEHPARDEPTRRRPLHIREELDEGMAGEPLAAAFEAPANEAVEDLAEPAGAAHRPRTLQAAAEGFMILTPQPVHPPRAAPDLDRLLEQFDTAIAAFRSGDDERPQNGSGRADPVHAFVARQTGTPPPSALGELVPDHQAELRAALDKLARAQRGD